MPRDMRAPTFSEVAPAAVEEDLSEGLYNTAQWAFGPEGISSLDVIGFGDFTGDGPHKRFNIILLRNTDPVQQGEDETKRRRAFRLMRSNDVGDLALFDKYAEAFGCCP